jgi:hypothetical protein
VANFPNGLELTPAGEALNAKLLTRGIPFEVDAIVVGDGVWNGPGFPDVLVNQVYSAETVRTYIVTPHIAVFEVDLTPMQKQITDNVHLREIGVIAVDPDDGPILYSYGNAGNDYDTIPPSGGSSFVKQLLRIPIKIANSANIVLNIEQTVSSGIIGGSFITVSDIGDKTVISLNALLKYFTDSFTTEEDQDEFTLTNTHINGALTVFIEGAAASPDEWNIEDGKVKLSYPLPEGRKVWIQEARLVEGGGNG